MANKNNQFIPLFDEYKDWCKNNLTKGKSADDYPSRLQKINREFICKIDTGSKKQPLELLEKYLTSSAKNGPKVNLIEAFLSAIISCLTQEFKRQKNTSDTHVSFGSEKSAYNNYTRFILKHVTSGSHRKNKISQTEEAVLCHIVGTHIVLDKYSLIDIFTSRLSTQDRITGVKAFVPLGLLTKICKKGTIHQWAYDAANKVLIHSQNGKVPVSNVETLTIDTETKKVTIELTDGTVEEVYNPPLNGVKTPMLINMISDTDIDHDPDIHSVLVSMKGSLPALDYITGQIRAAQKVLGYTTINSKNCNSIYAYLEADAAFMTKAKQLSAALINELDQIANNHILQLTTAAWNRSTKKQQKVTVGLAATKIQQLLDNGVISPTTEVCGGDGCADLDGYTASSVKGNKKSFIVSLVFSDPGVVKPLTVTDLLDSLSKHENKDTMFKVRLNSIKNPRPVKDIYAGYDCNDLMCVLKTDLSE